MLAFVDESGDPGMKVSRGSSAIFAVAIVTFDSRDEAYACDSAISLLRHELSIPKDFEFHFAQNSKRVRQAFLEAVAAFDFSYHSFGLNKVEATGRGFQYPRSLYKWTAKTAFENARPHLSDATVVLDRCGERKFRDELAAYLRRQINVRGGPRHIAKLKLQDSHQNNLLQLADYVVGLSAGAMKGNRDHRITEQKYLEKHCLTRRLWP